MPEHSPEPWIVGWWEQKQVGHKLYYTFRTDPNRVHSRMDGIYAGVDAGTVVHCSDFNRGRGCGTMVVGLFGGEDYDSDSYLVLTAADAHHAVACVNALTGIPTGRLKNLRPMFLQASQYNGMFPIEPQKISTEFCEELVELAVGRKCKIEFIDE